jgi:hypothetical protein
MTQQKNLPHHAILLLHLPASMGGIGIRDPITATIPVYITTITRTLRYAQHGIPLANRNTLQLPNIHQHAFQQTRYPTILDHFSPTFLPLINEKDKTTHSLPQFIQQTPLQGLQ